jgi:hypothetical protein
MVADGNRIAATCTGCREPTSDGFLPSSVTGFRISEQAVKRPDVDEDLQRL